jgi:hypothetical protein
MTALNSYWYALVGAILFLLLSPGILVTVPNSKDCGAMIPIIRGKKECATSILAVLVHSVIFGAVFAVTIFIIKTKFKD